MHLKPEGRSFLYDLNSSEPRVEDSTVGHSRAFATHDTPTTDIAATKSVLKNSNEGVVFNLTSTVGKRKELLCHYPLFQASEGQAGAGSEGGRDYHCGFTNNNVGGTVDGEKKRGDDGESKGDDSGSDGDSDR